MDIGVLFHMTPNKQCSKMYKAGHTYSFWLADIKVCNIVDIGQVRFYMYDDSIRTLTDVKHIQVTKKNLISLRILHGNIFKFSYDDYALIKGIQFSYIGDERRMTAGNVYQLIENMVVGGAATAVSESECTTLWHMRMGHTGEK